MATTMNELESIYERGFQLRCEGRYGEAKAELTKILSAQPNHVNAKHQIALILGFEGDFDGSLLSLTNLAAQVPSNLEVLYDLAMTQIMLGMSDEACTNFKKILSIDPGHKKAAQQVVYCP
jgi:tetratricopeptide (TPR) repeat protein